MCSACCALLCYVLCVVYVNQCFLYMFCSASFASRLFLPYSPLVEFLYMLCVVLCVMLSRFVLCSVLFCSVLCCVLLLCVPLPCLLFCPCYPLELFDLFESFRVFQVFDLYNTLTHFNPFDSFEVLDLLHIPTIPKTIFRKLANCPTGSKCLTRGNCSECSKCLKLFEVFGVYIVHILPWRNSLFLYFYLSYLFNMVYWVSVRAVRSIRAV